MSDHLTPQTWHPPLGALPPEHISVTPPLPSSSTDAAVKLATRAHSRSSFSWKVSVAWRVFLPWGDELAPKPVFSVSRRRILGWPGVASQCENCASFLRLVSVHGGDHRTGCGCPCSTCHDQVQSKGQSAFRGAVARTCLSFCVLTSATLRRKPKRPCAF